ncbi:MAG: excalibur calcium-binding domain-containing protein [Chloroflexota bacterium]|nr:excalibur calcium-binding domain-containing protein [Chloroflexota bacterium]
MIALTMLALTACDSASGVLTSVTSMPLVVPTLMVLPSITPTSVPTETTTPALYLTAASYLTATANKVIDGALTETARAPTPTATLPPTPTIDAISVTIESMNATNAAAQRMIETLQAQMAGQSVTPTRLEASASITATPSPTVSATSDPVMAMPPLILYTRLPTDLYACASRTCALVERIDIGGAVIADGMIHGEEIDLNNTLWYRLNLNGSAAYIYTGRVSIQPPTQMPPPSISPEVTASVVPGSAPNICPRNCTEAVAWGLSAYQAAACGLDRDGDGVACYGD